MSRKWDGKKSTTTLCEKSLSKKNKRNPFDMLCSESLGRSSYRERFAYFYRVDEVRIIGSYQYEADNKDVIAREPFILRFQCPYTVVKDLVLIPVHTKPKDAERELDALDDVVKAVRKRWRTNNIMILGDFNADGRYLSKKKKEKIRICSAPYHWLIKDYVNTTTSDTADHTYDRIVVFGDHMYDAVVPYSAKPFNFKKAYRLSNASTQAISDHYPVEVQLYYCYY
ncbi:deoxyribonuclease-1-like isoform X1 [Micropterus dolomieu]|uniref:deoxyribonuclease-1-like isoform X1 n=2 Tax=Micropterus dolomieu TaxID=147949 RepID=UPI001E8D4BFD|nr:deoxyribonuclease-1-like isoform X1 [Micropterus dolomieu]XP_045884626.1 deoxyribonuclease-1-like isoform X1 [Micropterus dolomieu]